MKSLIGKGISVMDCWQHCGVKRGRVEISFSLMDYLRLKGLMMMMVRVMMGRRWMMPSDI